MSPDTAGTVTAGTVLGGYTIERLLGSGGMGAVYLARHPSIERSDALKVISAELSANPVLRERFRREAEIAATLDHPNIVRVYTRGETADGHLWIAMQYVEGTTAAAMRRAGPIPPDRLLGILSQVADALDYAHARHVLHRDVKPSNILLSGTGDDAGKRSLLADFGIARALDDAAIRLTLDGSIVATVAYASPEALEGGPVDHRSDLYSLGCTLYQMLTGRTPFAAAGQATRAQRVAHLWQPPPRPTALLPELPAGVDAVIATAMAKDPARRYQSARELVAAAAAALGQPSPAIDSAIEVSGDRNTLTYPSGHFSGPTEAVSPPDADTGEEGPDQPPRHRNAAAAQHHRRIPRAVYAVAAGVLAVVLSTFILHPPAPYPAQDFTHTFGSTRLDKRPAEVAALGPGDADIMASLGVAPAAIPTMPNGRIPVWLRELLDSTPAAMVDEDTVAVLDHVRPELIINTSGHLARPAYDTLAAIAPTITRPLRTGAVSVEGRLFWIADILGVQNRVADVRRELESARNDIRTQYPNFAGKTVSVFGLNDAGLNAQLSRSPAAEYLTGRGFTYNPSLAGNDSNDKPIEQGAIGPALGSDLAVVVRTDSAAGNGGFYGLPDALLVFSGRVIIVDDADTVAALLTAGPAAARYLDTTLVPVLAGQRT